MRIPHMCFPALSLLAPLAAQTVGINMSALTPLTVQVTDGVTSNSNTLPAGPLASAYSLQTGIPGGGAWIGWNATSGNRAATVVLDHDLYNLLPTPTVVAHAGPNEYLVEFTAASPVAASLRVDRWAELSPGTVSPSMQLDYDNDGVIDVASVPTLSPLTVSRQFGPQPFRIRVLVDANLLGTARSMTRLWFTLTPDNSLTIAPLVTSCVVGSPQPPQFLAPSFVGRGVDIWQGQDPSAPAVAVIGVNAQPTLIGAAFGMPCLLLPTPDVVLFTGQLDVPLPAALRPVTFFAQGVRLTSNGLVVSDGYAVIAH